ncbi:MAG TPA: hypothetical protein VHH36_03825 [Candidatus Thermoplasmatota archaeon]|nr:hypothetical protein [Candidatus Thermoplasmatota archaeon]
MRVPILIAAAVAMTLAPQVSVADHLETHQSENYILSADLVTATLFPNDEDQRINVGGAHFTTTTRTKEVVISVSDALMGGHLSLLICQDTNLDGSCGTIAHGEMRIHVCGDESNFKFGTDLVGDVTHWDGVADGLIRIKAQTVPGQTWAFQPGGDDGSGDILVFVGAARGLAEEGGCLDDPNPATMGSIEMTLIFKLPDEP